VSASQTDNAVRNAPDFVALNLALSTGSAYIQVGLGEAIARQDTLIAADDRKAWIDELNQSVPIRLVDDDRSGGSRWVACPSPSFEDLVLQQCLTFMESLQHPAQAEEEADLWTRALATLRASESSASEGGAPAEVVEPDRPGFRLVVGQRRSSVATPFGAA
jgi:hypothetical protein